jgi:DinB superfamily
VLLRDWIVDEHAAVEAHFEQSVAAVVPPERWTDAAGDGGSSIAFLAFHTAYHEDLAVNAVLRGSQAILQSHRAALGLDGAPMSLGLAEAEPPGLAAALDLAALRAYGRAVHEATADHLAALDPATLELGAGGPAGLAAAGVEEADVPWLYRMWDGKPAAWFVQWEAIGHRVNHVGEMVSVRNRLGLSPF